MSLQSPPRGAVARQRTARAAGRRRWMVSGLIAECQHWLTVGLATARRHWLATVLLTAGLALRVLAQFAYRPALFYIDSERYLYNADGMDPVGYKAPLRGILFVANFNAVVAVQHLLALAMAVIIYVLLLRRGVARWLAALAIAPLLLDAYQLQTEQTIMPGTWFEALIVAGIAVLLWRPGISWGRVFAAGLVFGTAATVAQVGEALILPSVIFVFVAIRAGGGSARRAIGTVATMCAACAVPILIYCTGSYLLGGPFYLSHSGVTSFYGRMAAAADCATLRLPPAERGMCPTRAQAAKGSDWLEYGTDSPVQPYYKNLPREQTDSLIADFNRRVLTQQPLRVLSAYLHDVVKPFGLSRGTSPGDATIARWQFQLRFPYYPPHASEQVVRTATARFGGGAPAVWRPAAAFLRAYQHDGGYLPGPLFALVTLAGLIGSAAAFGLRRRRARAPDQVTGQPALACLLFFITGVSVILISDLFQYSWRYQLPALITIVPAGALGITIIAGWLTERAQSR